MNILQELAKFNGIKFYDEKHMYILDGRKQTSVTSLLSQFKEKFNSNFWATKKAEEEGMPF